MPVTKFEQPKYFSTGIHADSRGYFKERYSKKDYLFFPNVAQVNHSFNEKAGTLRGMHYQVKPHEQGKLVMVLQGAINDVIIDIRPKSPNYLQQYSFVLGGTLNMQLYVPRGFAHGFLTLEDETHVMYLVDNTYSKEHSTGFRYDDPAFNIVWPNIEKLENVEEYIVSEQDKLWPKFLV